MGAWGGGGEREEVNLLGTYYYKHASMTTLHFYANLYSDTSRMALFYLSVLSLVVCLLYLVSPFSPVSSRLT